MEWNQVDAEAIKALRAEKGNINTIPPHDATETIERAMEVTEEYKMILTDIAVNAPMEVAMDLLDELIRATTATNNFCAGVFNSRIRAAQKDEPTEFEAVEPEGA